MNPLSFSETANPDAIETHVALKMKEARIVPLSKDLSGILLSCMSMPEDLKFPVEKKPFLLQVITKRIQACHTFEIKEDRILLFLAAATESPGTAVLYLWYLQYWACKNNKHVIDFHDICAEIFPNGLFDKITMKDIWDGQKVQRKQDGSMGSDNLVDYSSAGESILMKDTVHKEQKNQ